MVLLKDFVQFAFAERNIFKEQLLKNVIFITLNTLIGKVTLTLTLTLTLL